MQAHIDPDEIFDNGLTLHQQGAFPEAEILYQKALQIDPTHPGALYFLGGMAYEDGRCEFAFELLNRLILDNPNDYEALHLLSLVATRLEKKQLAFELTDKVLKLQPAYAPAHLNLANQWQAQGQLEKAIASFRQAILLNPQCAEAHFNLGNIFSNQAKFAEAAASYRQALAINPNVISAHRSLGSTLVAQGLLDEAIAAYRQAIALFSSSAQPDLAPLYNEFGSALQNAGQHDAALASYRSAVSLQRDFPEAHVNLGNLLKMRGKLDQAISCYRQALSSRPDFPAALVNLGAALQEQGKFAEAVDSYRRALTLQPDFPIAHSNLGLALHAQGKLAEAIASYRQALIYKADFAEAHTYLGNVLAEQGRLDEAIASHQLAIYYRFDFPEAHTNLGNALKFKGRLGEAIASQRQALTLLPDFPVGHNNLGSALKSQGQLEEALVSFQRALELKPDYADAFHNYLLTVQYLPTYSREKLLAEHQLFAERFEAPLRAYWPAHSKADDPQRRLRVGFVSGDLHTHPVAFFLENALRNIDRQTIEIVLYPNSHKIDAVSERLRALASAWTPLTDMSDDDAAQRIRADRIDILVDLAGHTAHNRLLLFARKPAPLQVTWLGYGATTGLQSIDYILGDPHSIPDDESAFYVEKPWRLPDTRLCFTPPTDNIAASALPALRTGQITFGCFNNLTKMTDDVVTLWARILRGVENSRLFLKSKSLGDAVTRRMVLARFAAHGIAADRLLLELPSPRAEYFAAYHRVDVALDPFPFTGGTTSVEGLWMGVPMITLRGDHMIAHQGEMLLANLEMFDWIAADSDAYVALAIAKTKALPQLAQLRAELRARLLASPLCNGPLFARNLESAFRAMWREYCN